MERKWWKEAVVYQVYLRSFYDSNGDGIGDLKGLISKLDYIKALGVDVIWLNPVYKSPNDDNGYDISNYYDIMDEFGTLADWEELLKEMHSRGLRLIMDLVVNHTSDEHPWFVESRISKDSKKRDYYIWKEAKDGREPNNWASIFQGSAWEWDKDSCEYYLHLFSKKQPDLNWKNPEVRQEIYAMMKWWLDKGIDGFRMDVINAIAKAESLPDAPEPEGNDRPYINALDLYFNQPGVHELIQEMNREVLCKYDIMTVGETGHVTPEEGLLYVDESRNELYMIFQFQLQEIGEWDLVEFKRIQKNWYKTLEGKGWNSLYLNNHDQPRQVSHFGDDGKYRKESAKLLATLLHTMQGTPYIYQGEEIGMTNVAFPSIEYYNDIDTVNKYNEMVRSGKDPSEVLKLLQPLSRDNARTPMQWSSKWNAGFTTGKPWLEVNSNYREINVEQAQEDKDSILHYYMKLTRLRKENLTMVYGNFVPILEEDSKIYSYLRCLDNDRLLVILNFSSETVMFELPEKIHYHDKELLISNYDVDMMQELKGIKLRAYEAGVYRLK
ncbi:MAG TPA: alpha-glucosidase [Clostridia bacterium]|nr:alpha-glucosidase [Clostridia bacterium]